MNSFVLIIILSLIIHYILTCCTSYIPEFTGKYYELDPRQKNISIRMKDRGAFFCGDCTSHRNLLANHGKEIPCNIEMCNNQSGVGIDDQIHQVGKFVDLERLFF